MCDECTIYKQNNRNKIDRLRAATVCLKEEGKKEGQQTLTDHQDKSTHIPNKVAFDLFIHMRLAINTQHS